MTIRRWQTEFNEDGWTFVQAETKAFPEVRREYYFDSVEEAQDVSRPTYDEILAAQTVMTPSGPLVVPGGSSVPPGTSPIDVECTCEDKDFELHWITGDDGGLIPLCSPLADPIVKKRCEEFGLSTEYPYLPLNCNCEAMEAKNAKTWTCRRHGSCVAAPKHCNCGAAKGSRAFDYGAGHSPWCDVHESKKP